MPLNHIAILGAGPAGLSTALALAQLSRSQPADTAPLRITVLEVRPEPTTLGGAVNLTPLALRYLDRLGAGARLRPRGLRCRAIDLVSLRTGRPLGSLWAGVDALRVRRSALVAALLETCAEPDNAALVTVRFGVRVEAIAETGTPEGEGAVVLHLEGGEALAADVLVGADGIHSAARTLFVEPARQPVYTGRAVASTAIQASPGAASPAAALRLADGVPAVRDATLFQGRAGALLTTFGDAERAELHLSIVLGQTDVPLGSREGWRARGDDQAAVRDDVLGRFRGWRVPGLLEMLEGVEAWTLFPVFALAAGGRWSRGRVVLVGDAAHAMPPQGESTGICIEDGVLLAHVFQRHAARDVPQLFADYELLRRQTVEKLFKESTWRWKNAASHDSGYLWSVFIDWITFAFVAYMKWKQEDYFSSDVAKLELPQ